MRISFDLDDTLICWQPDTPSEPRPRWPLRQLVLDEPLRLGARELLRALRRRGWEVWIYTTSYRSPLRVHLWLLCHGVRVNRVINQRIHEAQLKREPSESIPSKNPRAFGIDLHVDDSDGVRAEGEQYGFEVVVVSPDDRKWTARVAEAVARLEGGEF